MDRTGGTDWHKNKVYIREYSPKTMNIVGVCTSTNSMYKDDNKISHQQKVLHMNKMLERVTHFQASFSVETTILMAESPRKHTLCTLLSIDQLYIFEQKWGTRKHIDDLKKYSWCIPVQKKIKPIIWRAAITPEPWNRQQW